MKISDAVAIRLKNILTEKGISAYSFIKKSGMAKNTVISILNSQNKSVTLKSILEIVDSLDMTVTEFFNDPLFDNKDLIIE